MEEKSIQFHYIYLPYRRDRSLFKYSFSNWILVARLYTAELFSFFFIGPVNAIVEKQKEREGFEPSIVFLSIPVFKTGAINHSAISPGDNFYSTPSYNP
jgi:hypothetical protein